MLDAFTVGQPYSNEEIFRSLKISNAGGIRFALNGKSVVRAAVMTSIQQLHGAGENPYHDRLEGDILTYTAAGKVGRQTLAGANSRLIEQSAFPFPVHGFVLKASRRDKSTGPRRWDYLGLLEYLRHYPDVQLDANGDVRPVWLFELKIHSECQVVPIASDQAISAEVLAHSRSERTFDPKDNEIVRKDERDMEGIEKVRRTLLGMEPRKFEFFLKDLLSHSGFRHVCVTRFSADGGIDLNARAGSRAWIFEGELVQVQAKRWLHSVGRKEVAELRGSLQPFAKGAVITTSHFSRAAITESSESGKNPITLVDGYKLSRIVLDEKFKL